jgi:hypothetical protein
VKTGGSGQFVDQRLEFVASWLGACWVMVRFSLFELLLEFRNATAILPAGPFIEDLVWRIA